MRFTTFAALLAVVSAGDAAAQVDADSTRIHRDAQRAQNRFERLRLGFLPPDDGPSSGPCDEYVGRFCFRYGDRDEVYEPPPDSEPLVALRTRLLDELADAARALPGDGWIAGQRVRYLIEARRPGEAAAAAEACRPPGYWWCLALRGYARHAAGAYAAADSAYAAALAGMPDDERCRWTDLGKLLDGSPLNYRRLPCAARDSIERRFWWLADPLDLVPGNERRTEHYSRWVMNQLQDDAVSPWGYAWTDDLREILIRFGWPAGWARARQSFGAADDWAVSATFRAPARAFEPPARFVETPEAIEAGQWSLVPAHPRGGYLPAYATRIDSLVAQVAVFRRGTGLVIVAGYDLSQDSVPPDAPAQAALFAAAAPGASGAHHVVHGTARGVVSLVAPGTPGLLSLEALAPAQRRAGRLRYWLQEPPAPAAGRPALSDLLLLSRADSLPHSLDAAAPLARASSVVSAGPVGLYWEVYGLGPGLQPYSVGLTVVRESAGFLRRAARAIGLAGPDRPQIRLSWDDLAQPGAAEGSSLALDLAGSRPGRYTIRLSVTAGGDSTTTARAITIDNR